MIKNIIASLHPAEIEVLVAKVKGTRLSEMLDAARDVAKQSDRADLQRTAQMIVTASRHSHPEYWDPTLNGA